MKKQERIDQLKARKTRLIDGDEFPEYTCPQCDHQANNPTCPNCHNDLMRDERKQIMYDGIAYCSQVIAELEDLDD